MARTRSLFTYVLGVFVFVVVVFNVWISSKKDLWVPNDHDVHKAGLLAEFAARPGVGSRKGKTSVRSNNNNNNKNVVAAPVIKNNVKEKQKKQQQQQQVAVEEEPSPEQVAEAVASPEEEAASEEEKNDHIESPPQEKREDQKIINQPREADESFQEEIEDHVEAPLASNRDEDSAHGDASILRRARGSVWDYLEEHGWTASSKTSTTEAGPIGSIFSEIREQVYGPPRGDEEDETTETRSVPEKVVTNNDQKQNVQQRAQGSSSNNATSFTNATNREIPPDHSLTAPMTSSIAWSNTTTLAFYMDGLKSGYRNQMMCFTILIMECMTQGHGQFLVESVAQKDTYGTNRLVPFEELWDVPHWNSYYPRLPRLVHWDPVLHSQYNHTKRRWHRTEDKKFGTYGLFVSEKPERPYAFGAQQNQLFGKYIRYSQGKTDFSIDGHRNPIEILMVKEAMRPHPNMRAIIDKLLHSLEGSSEGETVEYLTLHARVEPDMQAHPVCRDKKVVNLTQIFDFMEAKWKEPPVSKIFMPINRQYMEKEGQVNQKKPEKTNWIAVENLKALNRARDEGLWGGRAKVFEFGANALQGTVYEKNPSTAGAMLNFFISIGGKIFIGTEVSSYSHDLLATRFYRNMLDNYKYLPDGLHDWTPPGTEDPPGFTC